ncbi:MAG: peptidylprolyl isomerase [Lysobacterales bacterium 69-70]|nr:peptidylprolyl isomerase [Xanthomonadaceae bacterium]ODU34745.1 MAG: peptidylprolyl isomerase [Xanthomonadaceae bacterium SCN 69-320]ODV15879.1 MAG: peptidylprolyl isomerase [Xanthomonadaceae bacterium SCN 69-25]OJY94998.1 MAG: peptidylprolyl isomerase [Xanthomonadales bacterium 69-70]
MQIAERRVAAFHYTLTNDKGEVIDSSEGREPLVYLHGVGNIVPGLEREMSGKKAGDSFNVVVAPEEGYGVHHAQLIQQVPREAFQGVDTIEPGMQFHANGPQGPMTVTVAAVDGEMVTIDGNHPLAGQALHFAIEITGVRDASPEEILHGHVHGAGGHQH